MTKTAIFISGRGSNMQAILEQVHQGELGKRMQVGLVFSNLPQAPGLLKAVEAGVPVACLPVQGRKRAEYDALVVELLRIYDIEFIVLAGYMRILSPVLVDAFPRRIVNIHPADTRRHQGLDGYRWAWEQGVQETTITVHYVDSGLDTGEIIAQASVDLRGADSLQEVERRGLAVEHALYPQVLSQLLA